MDPERWQRVKQIFDAALEVEPAERDAIIADACAGDAVLRGDVMHLLASFDESDDFIEKTAVAENLSMFDAKLSSISSGQIFGRYVIDKPIGSGGMGEVYLATDQSLGRRVAIKVLRQEFARQQDNVRRFLREAKAASSLNHPNILVIYEIDIGHENNYIVSEYVEGETLRDRLRGKPMTLADILDITIQVGGALDAAHGASIIHRDIKPENIVVRPDGYVKVLDFGLAKLVESRPGFVGAEDATRHESQTAQGIIMGTVNYMSPEQAKGAAVDQRTDVFSLGVVLYEMITGATPFRGDSMSETFANLINGEPQPMSRYASNVPDELQRIVALTLRKNPNERYPSIKDLITDLKTFRKHLEFEKEYHRRGNFDAAGTWRTEMDAEIGETKVQDLNSIAVLPFVNIGSDIENEYFCDGLAEELLNALAKIKNLKVAARTSAFSFKGKNAPLGEIANALNVRTVLEGSVRKAGERVRITAKLVNAADGYQLWSERFDGEMKDIFQLQDEITLVVIEKLKVNFLSGEKAAVLKRLTDNPEAYESYLKGIYYRWKLIPEEFAKCLRYFQQAVEADPKFGMAYFGVASYYGYGTAWGLIDVPPDEGWLLAWAAIQKSLETDPNLPEIQLTLAAFDLVNYRKFDEAGAAIERAVAMNRSFPEIHHLYSFYLLTVGRLDEAVEDAKEALKLDPLSLNYSRFLGIALLCARRFDEAIDQFQQALELEPNNPSVYQVLGEAYVHKGMFEEALSAWKKGFAFEGDAELADIIENSNGNFGAATAAIARKRIEKLEARLADGHFVLAIHFVRAYMMLGDQNETFKWLERAVEERNVFPLFMQCDPFYDTLRPDPRFRELTMRIGFPENDDSIRLEKQV